MSKMLERLINSYLFNDPIVGTARRIVDPSGAQTVRRRGSGALLPAGCSTLFSEPYLLNPN